jgi:hypothetical protein
MRATVTLPDGRVVRLIGIDDWDFRWQDVYRYAEPLALPRGSTIAMSFTYDNSAANPRNPHQPPVRVVWGQNTTDEMGDFWLQIVPQKASGLRRVESGCPPEGALGRSCRVHEAAANRSGQSPAS